MFKKRCLTNPKTDATNNIKAKMIIFLRHALHGMDDYIIIPKKTERFSHCKKSCRERLYDHCLLLQCGQFYLSLPTQ